MVPTVVKLLEHQRGTAVGLPKTPLRLSQSVRLHGSLLPFNARRWVTSARLESGIPCQLAGDDARQ